jgi:hypothetical protein
MVNRYVIAILPAILEEIRHNFKRCIPDEARISLDIRRYIIRMSNSAWALLTSENAGLQIFL